MSYTVLFLPENKKITLDTPENLLNICDKANVIIDGTCAGKGICGKCKVKIVEGSGSPLTEIEQQTLSAGEIESGVRLACQMEISDDLTVMMPDIHGSSTRKKKMNKLPDTFVADPAVKKIFVKLKKAKLDAPFSDIDMLRKELAMPELKAELPALISLQKALAAKRRKITAVIRNQELLLAESDDTTAYCYGVAFDIGTTTIVGILWNLLTGEMIDVEAATNPQSVYGSDVISRIQYCIEGTQTGEDHTKVLHEKVIKCFNDMLDMFCLRNGIEHDWIYDITTVGNTTMSHLYLGIHPASLAKVPFAPVYSGGISYAANDMGLKINPLARGYVLPNIAGHVGADITAVMLATDIFHLPGNTVAIDVGTNGEILVASDGVVKTCSTAAGPAFEGACIQCGMRAAKGAIEKVVIDDDVHISVIEDAEPVGICGSGLIDSIAQLLASGLMEENGNLLTKEQAISAGLPTALQDRLNGEGNSKAFILARKEEGDDIVITQKDIREVQLAKGAILGGMLTLMKKTGFTVDRIDRVLIAGAFGSYIDKSNAILMGLLPKVGEEIVQSIGNGAGVGSSMALLSADQRIKAEQQVREIEHVELSQDMDFQEYYIESMLFTK